MASHMSFNFLFVFCSSSFFCFAVVEGCFCPNSLSLSVSLLLLYVITPRKHTHTQINHTSGAVCYTWKQSVLPCLGHGNLITQLIMVMVYLTDLFLSMGNFGFAIILFVFETYFKTSTTQCHRRIWGCKA